MSIARKFRSMLKTRDAVLFIQTALNERRNFENLVHISYIYLSFSNSLYSCTNSINKKRPEGMLPMDSDALHQIQV